MPITYVYIYIYRERERDRYIDRYIDIFIYTYIYICINHTTIAELRQLRALLADDDSSNTHTKDNSNDGMNISNNTINRNGKHINSKHSNDSGELSLVADRWGQHSWGRCKSNDV